MQRLQHEIPSHMRTQGIVEPPCMLAAEMALEREQVTAGQM